MLHVALPTFLAVLALCAVYAVARVSGIGQHRWTPRMLSFASGLSVSYVFLDLLPGLSKRQSALDAVGWLSALNRHVYILALVGLVVAFWVETAARESRMRQRQQGLADQTAKFAFMLSMTSAIVQHVATGYAVGTPGDQAVDPLWLFAVALGLHFLVNDHAMAEHHGPRYEGKGRWLLVAALLLGWLIGVIDSIRIPDVVLTLVLSYLAGGTILNIIRHELPDTRRTSDVGAFALGAACYTVLLLYLP